MKKLFIVVFIFMAVGLFAQQGADVEFARVDGGTFQREGYTITISTFYMGKYEVTQAQWAAVMGSNPSRNQGDKLPVTDVSWFDAIEYCNRLSQKEGLTPVYTISGTGNDRTVTWKREANGYRLPTEAEWEYAARGGNGSPGNYTYAGSNNIDEVAWYKENSGNSAHEVGTKKPNGLGLFDMIGNAGEWCYDYSYDYAKAAQKDPINALPPGERLEIRNRQTGEISPFNFRVIRGGSYYDEYTSIRQGQGQPGVKSNRLGFRIALNG